MNLISNSIEKGLALTLNIFFLIYDRVQDLLFIKFRTAPLILLFRMTYLV